MRNVFAPRGGDARPSATVTLAGVIRVAVASKPNAQGPMSATPPSSPTTHNAADEESPGFQPVAICTRNGTSRAYPASGPIAALTAAASAVASSETAGAAGRPAVVT